MRRRRRVSWMPEYQSVQLVGPTYLHPAFTVTRSGTATYRDGTGTIQTAAANTPRFDHDSNGNPLGLLVEESRTNLLTYSEQFDNAAWTKTNVTVTANATTAPDGTVTMDAVIPNTSTVYHTIQHAFTSAASTQYVYAAYVKAAGYTYAAVGVSLAAGEANIVINLSTGAIAGTNGALSLDDYGVTDCGNGIYRAWVVATENATGSATSKGYVGPLPTSTYINYAGDGTSGVYAWGAQVEAGAFPTSYIPTTTAAVTRSADDVIVSTLSGIGYNASAGSIVAEYAQSGILADATPWSLSDGTTNHQLRARMNAPGQIYTFEKESAASASTAAQSTNSPQAANKISSCYDSSSICISTNGLAVASATSVALSSVTTFAVGSLASANYLNGWMKSLYYYPERLSDGQLVSLST